MAPTPLAPTQGGANKRERKHWKLWEDIKLSEFVARHGAREWKLISEHLPGRSDKSCRLRWLDHLDPKINKTVFTKEENEVLIRAHEIYGNKWSQIATFLPGRTDNRIKNQWHVLTSQAHKNVNGVSSSSAYNHHLPIDSASTITLFGKSTVISVITVANGGGYKVVTNTLVPSTVVDPPARTKFIDFLGVGDQ